MHRLECRHRLPRKVSVTVTQLVAVTEKVTKCLSITHGISVKAQALETKVIEGGKLANGLDAKARVTSYKNVSSNWQKMKQVGSLSYTTVFLDFSSQV